MKRIRFVVLSCVMAAAATAGFAAAEGGTGPALQGMDRLKSLAGKWEGKAPGPEEMPITVTFTTTADGSAVMEQLSVGQMITMYHQDGDHLMLTHYCAGNNQPRMRAAGLSGDGKKIAFKFHDITNLSAPGASHMKGLTIEFLDENHISQEWTHAGAGGEAPMKFVLTRVK